MTNGGCIREELLKYYEDRFYPEISISASKKIYRKCVTTEDIDINVVAETIVNEQNELIKEKKIQKIFDVKDKKDFFKTIG